MTDLANDRTPTTRDRAALATLAAGGGALLWAYWPSLSAMARRWGDDPRYSHGYLVPAFAAAWLWLRRGRIAAAVGRPSAWGLGLIAAGLALRMAGGFAFFEWAESISLLPCVAGLVVLGGGWPLLRQTWPAVAFLGFMVPWPYQVEMAMSWPLQRAATVIGTYALQTLGLPAVGAGNIINIGEAQIGVVEACSGLSMLVLFMALATAVAMLSRRPLWERLMLVAGAVPIALTANITRIVATAVVHETLGARFADLVFHDLAGWLMMPLALALLCAEAWVLARLLLPSDEDAEVRDDRPARVGKSAETFRARASGEAPGRPSATLTVKTGDPIRGAGR